MKKRAKDLLAEQSENGIAPDPIANLLTGIQFRNGGKAEAVRRIRGFVEQQLKEQINQSIHSVTADIRVKEEEIRRLQREEICRLQRAIRTVKAQSAEAVIEAARPVLEIGLEYQGKSGGQTWLKTH